MSGLEIKPVTTARERSAFIKMPWLLYEDDPHWVPPLIADQKEFLDPGKGVFFQHGEARLWIAYRGSRPVGRISAQVNHRHDELYDDAKGFFGFFECADDQQAATALFETAETYLREKKRKLVEGPFNFSIYDEIGVLIDGFDTDPYVLNLHNPPYYQKLIEAAGYDKSVDWYAFRATRGMDSAVPPKLLKLRDRIVKRRGITIRNMDPKHFDDEAAMVKKVFDQAWDRNWGHVPMTDAEFARVSDAIKRLIIPELSFFAMVKGEVAGFALSLYDANVIAKQINGRLFPFGFIKFLSQMKKIDRFRLILLGVLEEHRNRGYEIVFITNVIEQAHKMHFNEAEMSLIVENNDPMLRSLEHLPVERYKTYRIFQKEL